MKRINNIVELRQERARLRMQVTKLEREIKNDVESIKDDLKPINIIVNAANKMFNRTDAGLTTAGLNLGIDVLLRNVLLRNAGFLYKLVIPFFVKNMTSNYVADHGINFVDIAKNLFNKWRGKSNGPIYDRATADTNY